MKARPLLVYFYFYFAVLCRNCCIELSLYFPWFSEGAERQVFFFFTGMRLLFLRCDTEEGNRNLLTFFGFSGYTYMYHDVPEVELSNPTVSIPKDMKKS